MIYEILIRPSDSKKITSDHLIWIDAAMTTRQFENWLRGKSLIGNGHSHIVRWSIVQTKAAAHFNLATQESALMNKVTELISATPTVVGMPDANRAIDAIRAKSAASELLAA